MFDRYANDWCSNGSCPLLIEEEMYGLMTSSCTDYCGYGFHGCNTCSFEGSEICIDCIHSLEAR